LLEYFTEMLIKNGSNLFKHFHIADKYISKRNVVYNNKIGILGSPFNKGQPKGGVECGPQAIRDACLIDKLNQTFPCFDIQDCADVTYEYKEGCQIDNLKNYDHVMQFNQALHCKIAKMLEDGRLVLHLGGDHSTAYGSIQGHIKYAKPNNVALLWVDAHSDLNTAATSDTGNMHGMPVGLLLKEVKKYWPNLPGTEWTNPCFPAKNIAYIGLRSVDNYERFLIDTLNITAFSSQDVHRVGIDKIVDIAMQKIDPEGTRSIHVSFDIDSLDPLEAPATGTPVRGGLLLREGVNIMEKIASTGRLRVVDLVEVNPSLACETGAKNTVDAALMILLASVGAETRGNLVGIKKMKGP